jgi:hypothetical protein
MRFVIPDLTGSPALFGMRALAPKFAPMPQTVRAGNALQNIFQSSNEL